MEKKYAQIIPILKLPKSLGIFSYKLPDEFHNTLRKGDLVSIPFRKTSVKGVVYSIEKPKYILSEIKNIFALLEKNFLQGYQLDLIEWMSEYYFQSPAVILKAMVPFIPKKIPKEEKSQGREFPKITKTETAKKLYHHPSKKILALGSLALEDEIALLSLFLEEKKQALVLFPEVSLTQRSLSEYEKYFPSRVLSLTSSFSKGAQYRVWKKIRSGEPIILIGTRKAIFSPFPYLGLILIHEEEDASYKQWDKNPRYHARDVLMQISEFTKSKIIIQSIAPETQTYAKTLKNFTLFPLNLPKGKIEFVDMRNEPHHYPKHSLSETLEEALKEFSGTAVLLINQRGDATSVLCGDCGLVARCPQCELPYTYYQNEIGMLRCHQCNTSSALAKLCPHCHGARFRFYGMGTKSVVKDVQKLYPEYVVARIDSDISSSRREEIVREFLLKKIKILVATQTIFNELLFHKTIDLFALISADTFLFIPEYTSTEKTFRLILSACTFGKRVIIQTHNPENYGIRFGAKCDYRGFYLHELSYRKKFEYPPYSKFIKCISQSYEREKAENSAEKLAMILKKTSRGKNIEILGPYPAATLFTRGRYRWHVLIKIKNPREDISSLIKLVPHDFLIDVDPLKLF